MRIYLGSGVSKQYYMFDNLLLKDFWLGRVNVFRENFVNGNEEGICLFFRFSNEGQGKNIYYCL